MASKSKKTHKAKRAPVRVISPQTVEMPSETAPASVKQETRSQEARPSVSYPVQKESRPSTIVQEIKRTGIIAAVVLAVLIVLSFIF